MNADNLITALGTVTHTTLAGVGSMTIEPTEQQTTPSTQKNFARLSPDISFVDAAGEQEGGYYSVIQGHKITRRNTRIRLYFIHSVIDVDTNDAAGLRRIIYQKQRSEIKAGDTYEDVKIIAISFIDSDNIPALPS